jgi:DtxR family Mn-dependent transcriptional regulator
MELNTTFLFWTAIILLTAFLLFWPGRGLLARWKDYQRSSQQRLIEDALKFIFHSQQEGKKIHTTALVHSIRLSVKNTNRLIQKMLAQGLLQQRQSALELTPEGQRVAMHVIRAHRLWERYLADEARLPLSDLHRLAHRKEHGMTTEEIDHLDASLGHPSRDPHGDPIPSAEGVMRWTGTGRPLPDFQAGERGEVVHLEDEPQLAFDQLLAEGLRVGGIVTVLENSKDRLVLIDGEKEITLAPTIAANVFLQEPEKSPANPNGTITLAELQGRAQGEIVDLDRNCQGFTRRRFLDLGLTPGTKISQELDNAFREPRAYRVRGTLIALRNDQASQILVRPISNKSLVH